MRLQLTVKVPNKQKEKRAAVQGRLMQLFLSMLVGKTVGGVESSVADP
jgi:hypothetical protein